MDGKEREMRSLRGIQTLFGLMDSICDLISSFFFSLLPSPFSLPLSSTLGLNTPSWRRRHSHRMQVYFPVCLFLFCYTWHVYLGLHPIQVHPSTRKHICSENVNEKESSFTFLTLNTLVFSCNCILTMPLLCPSQQPTYKPPEKEHTHHAASFLSLPLPRRTTIAHD